MCGITMLWSREGVFSLEDVTTVLTWAEKRGEDGYGVAVYHPKQPGLIAVYKSMKPFTKDKHEFFNWLSTTYFGEVGSVLLAISRATPETEAQSVDDRSLQPIVKHSKVLIHNGSIANETINKYIITPRVSDIDSEVILDVFEKTRDLKTTCEKLLGGFAFIILDPAIRRVYVATNFRPLAFSYIRGKGLIVHSLLDPVKEIIYRVTNAPRTGLCV